jgi:tRNA-2-methylthio-N6-dimethylallyladenosine synthase
MEQGYEEVSLPGEADLIVINTCTVRKKPEHKVYSLLGRFKKLKEKRPELKIVVMGCLAQQEGENLLERFPQVDMVLGPDRIDDFPGGLERITNGERVCMIGFKEDPSQRVLLPPSRSVRAYVNIMQGCDNFCSYCIVPYVRGPEKSRPSQEILKEIRLLAKEGVKEVILLGQNVNAYGKKSPGECSFVELLRKIAEIPGIERIRFTTSHPKDLGEDLILAFKEIPQLCEHIHLPFQAGSNKILKMMRRGYTREEYLQKIERLREVVPEIAITADVIVGFPGEEEEDFEETLDLVRQVRFDGLFSFKYSPRKGTLASKWPDDVPEEVKARRLEELQSLQRKITLEKHEALEGQVLEVLVEGCGDRQGQLKGRSRCNQVVIFQGPIGLIGKTVWVKIKEGLPNCLRGELHLGKKEVLYA